MRANIEKVDILGWNHSCSLMSTVPIPTIQHNPLPPIIHKHTYYYSTYVYSPPHQRSPKFTTFIRKTYLHHIMYAWGKQKPANFPKTAWRNPGWGHCDPDWRIKAPGRPTLLKQQTPHPLEFTIHHTKNCCS